MSFGLRYSHNGLPAKLLSSSDILVKWAFTRTPREKQAVPPLEPETETSASTELIALPMLDNTLSTVIVVPFVGSAPLPPRPPPPPATPPPPCPIPFPYPLGAGLPINAFHPSLAELTTV